MMGRSFFGQIFVNKVCAVVFILFSSGRELLKEDVTTIETSKKEAKAEREFVKILVAIPEQWRDSGVLEAVCRGVGEEGDPCRQGLWCTHNTLTKSSDRVYSIRKAESDA